MHLRLGPQRQRGESEQAGAGADVGDVGEARLRSRSSRSSAARQPLVVACWPVPKARLASISKLIALGIGRDRSGVWTVKRPARIGCSPAWLIVTQSASPSCSTCGWPLPRLASSVQFVRRRLVLEISVDQPLVGLGLVGLVGDQHRRRSPKPGKLVHRADRFALRAGAGDGDSPARLGCAASFASRSSSAAWPAPRIVPAAVRGRSAAPCRRAARACCSRRGAA